MSKIKVERIINGALAEFCYLIHDINSKECVCVDPGYDEDRIFAYIDKEDFVVKDILLTHGHFDHMLSCFGLQKRFQCDIYISKEDAYILYNAENNYANLISKNTFDKFDIKQFVRDGDLLRLLNYEIKCIATPGHTKGGVSYYFENEKLLFSGDTLFAGTYGRIDLYSGNYDEIKYSIENKLFTLPDDIVVYPGHGDVTYIGQEKLYNEIRGEIL